jgi:hypothetical protein
MLDPVVLNDVCNMNSEMRFGKYKGKTPCFPTLEEVRKNVDNGKNFQMRFPTETFPIPPKE